jgi:aldehyde dehydrogenase (NAD+)
MTTQPSPQDATAEVHRALETDDHGTTAPRFGSRHLLIGGEFLESESGSVFETTNPATGEVLASVSSGNSEDIDKAVWSARNAFDNEWKRVKPYDRQRILLRFADLFESRHEEIAMLDTLDMGAPITLMRSRRDANAARIRYFAGLTVGIQGETIPNSISGNVFSYTVKEPVGVVGAITPWNGPQTGAIWKLVPALAAGCTVVLKPAEEAPLTALLLGELLLEAGVPPGVVNVVPGDGPTTGSALARHGDVDKIAFTGSTTTGREIVKDSAVNLKRVSLELGGKSPDIVFADADLEAAVPGVATAIFANSGQICSAGSRLFVERKVFDDFVAHVVAYASQLVVGDGMDARTDIGPLASARQLNRVTGYVESGRNEGARTLCGGDRLLEEPMTHGFFMPPTVFTDVTSDMRIAREEIFGPVLCAIPFDDVEDVIALANDSPYGLGSGVWTRDIDRAHFLARELASGSVWINCYNANDPAMPFGGYKMSGYGREGSIHQLDDYLNVKAVWVRESQ